MHMICNIYACASHARTRPSVLMTCTKFEKRFAPLMPESRGLKEELLAGPYDLGSNRYAANKAHEQACLYSFCLDRASTEVN